MKTPRRWVLVGLTTLLLSVTGLSIYAMGMKPVGGPSGTLWDIFKSSDKSKPGDATNTLSALKKADIPVPSADISPSTDVAPTPAAVEAAPSVETPTPAVEVDPAAASFVSLGPNITEIFFDIGAQDRLVGITEECDFPPETKRIAKVGRFGHPNLEALVALKPKYILSPHASHPVMATYHRLGLPVLAMGSDKIEDIYQMYKKIGELTNLKSSAERRVRTLQAKLALLEKNMPEKKPKVYFELWGNPPMTVGFNSYLNDLIQRAGGTNIAGTIGKPYPLVDPELVIGADPEVIILAYETDENISIRPGWDKINAVINHRVFTLPHPDLLLRPGPRVADGIRELRALLYPSGLSAPAK